MIVIDIPALPLTPGDYQVEVQIKDGSRTVDFVGPAAEFAVTPADLYDEGYRFDSSNGFDDGCFVVPWEWEIRPGPDRYAEMAPLVSTEDRGIEWTAGESGIPFEVR